MDRNNEEGARMERYLNTPVKQTIDRFPSVGTILEEFGIGCVPCNAGSCRLSDVVEIHNLSPEDEEALVRKIAAVVTRGQPVSLPERRTPRPGQSRTISYSPPMKRLVDEHTQIKRFLALVPGIVERLDLESEEGRDRILRGVDFIRNYADRYHHAKEEDILFTCFPPELDILQAMLEDHRRGRARVNGILEALERRDREGVAADLYGYAAILAEHIKKEDEILYPWMDRNFSTRQVGEMYSRFQEVDERFREAREKYESIVANLENTFMAQGAEVDR